MGALPPLVAVVANVVSEPEQIVSVQAGLAARVMAGNTDGSMVMALVAYLVAQLLLTV